jgi:hypothetical protein
MDTAIPGCVVDGESVNEAMGGWFDGVETVTGRVVDAVAPLLSWTVNVTVYVPADPKAWLVETPLPLVPSPNAQE